jgi:hypothetical protein
MERAIKQIEQDICHVVYYMNGGISYIDAYSISMAQLTHLNEQINTHFQAQADAYKTPKK